LRILEKLAKACAILAGVLLTAITLMTCVSLIGRNTIGHHAGGRLRAHRGCRRRGHRPVSCPGARCSRGNIIVDFFTAKASDRTNAMLDRFGALLLGLVCCRDGLAHRRGRPERLDSQSGTMMLGFPEWVVYVHGAAPAPDRTHRLWQAFRRRVNEAESHA
jgi:TRAP-type C4-dicarboxylate transport system permease small subunit